jgi:hypothetical protein
VLECREVELGEEHGDRAMLWEEELDELLGTCWVPQQGGSAEQEDKDPGLLPERPVALLDNQQALRKEDAEYELDSYRELLAEAAPGPEHMHPVQSAEV